MDENMEVFEYDNTEPEDAWWNEGQDEEVSDVSEEGTGEDGVSDSSILDELIEALTPSQNYGTMGDYYNHTLGCYVFPNHEVYAFFIDVDTDGVNWVEASDGHFVPALYLEAYEEYIYSGENPEEPAEPEETQLSEHDLQSLETLEGVRGLLSVIKENDAVFYGDVLDYEAEMLVCAKETSARVEGLLYCGITCSIFLGIIAGTFTAHVFFGRMRV